MCDFSLRVPRIFFPGFTHVRRTHVKTTKYKGKQKALIKVWLIYSCNLATLVQTPEKQLNSKEINGATLFPTKIAIFLSVKENARIKFYFSALLFPKEVLKVVRCIDKAVRV